MNKRVWSASCSAAICMLALGTVLAQDEGGEGAMSAEQQAMLEAWRKAAETTPHHDWLMQGVGDWHVEQKMWKEPGAEPVESEAEAHREALLGGRVLRESFSATFMGEPHNGLAHSGYDSVTGNYWVTWMDNFSTALYTGQGECEDDHSSCSYRVKGTDPMTGGTHNMRIEIDFADRQETHTFYETRNGEEMKSMVMVYTRAE